MKSRTPLESWPPRLIAIFLVLVGVGFCLHTSFDPVIAGKYSRNYFLALCFWFFFVLPIGFLLARWAFRPTGITLSSGNKVQITPVHKIAALAVVLGILITFGRGAIQRRRLDRSPFTFHPHLQTAYKPNQPALGINRWGFRGRDIEKQKTADAVRIFMFGESTMASLEVGFEDSHCRILERMLQKQYPDRAIEVQNVGVPWHSSEHSLIKLLFDVQDFSPDLVIIYHAMGDLLRGFDQPDFTHRPYRDDYGHYDGPVADLVKGRGFDLNGLPISMITGFWLSDFRFDRVRLLGPEGKGIEGVRTLFVPKADRVTVDHWRSLAPFARNLENFARIARGKGFQVLIATEPYLYRPDSSDREREVFLFPMTCRENGKQPDIISMKNGMDAFNAKSRQVADECGVFFFDLEAQIPKSLDYFYDDIHYTLKGNTAVAESLARYIIHSGILANSVTRGAGFWSPLCTRFVLGNIPISRETSPEAELASPGT